MVIFAISLVFWFGIFLLIRGHLNAKKTGHEAEIVRLRAAQAGVVQPAAPAPAAKAGPSKAATAAQAVGKAAKWTAPRLVAGTAVVSKASVKGAKAAVNKAKAAQAAKSATAAKPAKPAGGNVLSPEQEKDLATPAFMRAGKIINLAEHRENGRTLH